MHAILARLDEHSTDFRASGLFPPSLWGRVEVFSLPPCGGGLGWGGHHSLAPLP